MPYIDKKKRAESQLAYYHKRKAVDPEFFPARQRAIRNSEVVRKYGITLADVEAMTEAQGGLCKICRIPQERTLCVDHDHKTGRVRGLLCFACNRGIGSLRDNTSILHASIRYLSPEPGFASGDVGC